MGQAARKKVIDRFTLDKSAGRLAELFKQHAAASIGKEPRCELP